MTKVVWNACYGGFGLSILGKKLYKELGGETEWDHDIKRDDPLLVQVVEELGEKSFGGFARLLVTDLPSGTRYRIQEYDGYESIETETDIEWEVA